MCVLPYWSVSVKSKAGMTSACSGEEEEGAGDEDGACAPGSSDGPDCSGAACEDEVEAASPSETDGAPNELK